MSMAERFLERIGILKHKITIEEIDAANKRLRQLTADYLRGQMSLQDYATETDKLPKLDLRQLAHDLNFKG